MEKIVYLVRHGETEGNIQNAVQDGTDPLSNLGRKQAQRVADRVKNIEFDALIASDYIRAVETAEVIAAATGKSFSQSPHFREVAHPSALVGVPRTDERFVVYHQAQMAHISDPSWHYADEENFFDLHERAKKAEAELLAHASESILVVSHANFMKCLIGHFIFGPAFTAETFRHLRLALTPSNTGLSILRYHHDRWHLVTWNDHSHLAEAAE